MRIYILVITLVFISCEKVIEVPLRDADKKIVIEAVVTDEKGGCNVKLSHTKAFADDNQFSGISDAIVAITDGTGSQHILYEVRPGIYQDSLLSGTTGEIFNLRIQVNDEVFTAKSTMPVKIPIDTFYISNEPFFGTVQKLTTIEITDPAGIYNGYRFVQYINGIKDNNIYIRDDAYSDGNQVIVKLFAPGEEEKELKTGDNVLVELQCIEEPVYKYWFSLEMGATGESISATPANPVSNISGGALGYFSAHTAERKSIRVP